MKSYKIILAVLVLMGALMLWNRIQPRYFPTDNQRAASLIEEARLFEEAGKFREALNAYDTAAGYDPANVLIPERQILFLFRTGKVDEADAHFNHYIAKVEDDTDLLNAGTHFYQSGYLRGARHCYGKLLELNPADPLACLGMARVFHELDRPDSAYAYYQQALQKGYDSQVIYLHLAFLFAEKMHSRDSTQRYYRKYLSRGGDPNTILMEWLGDSREEE